MEGTLKVIDPVYAEHVLRQVEYPERLVGLKMSAMGGSNPSELYSLEQVAKFIHIDDYEVALKDNHATVGYVDPAALARWISEVLGDAELSGSVSAIAVPGAFYGKIALQLKDALLVRIAELRAALASPADADALGDAGIEPAAVE